MGVCAMAVPRARQIKPTTVDADTIDLSFAFIGSWSSHCAVIKLINLQSLMLLFGRDQSCFKDVRRAENDALMRQIRRSSILVAMARFSVTFSRTRIPMVAELLLANAAVIPPNPKRTSGRSPQPSPHGASPDPSNRTRRANSKGKPAHGSHRERMPAPLFPGLQYSSLNRLGNQPEFVILQQSKCPSNVQAGGTQTSWRERSLSGARPTRSLSGAVGYSATPIHARAEPNV